MTYASFGGVGSHVCIKWLFYSDDVQGHAWCSRCLFIDCYFDLVCIMKASRDTCHCAPITLLFIHPMGVTWLQLCRDVSFQKGRTWVLFWLQGSEMSECISRKMAVKFAASLNMGNKMLGIVHDYI